MNASELRERLHRNEKLVLIDVRELDEIQEDPYFAVPPANFLSIPLGVLSVLPLEELALRLKEVTDRLGWKESETNIVTLCHSGRRSEMACARLTSLGLRAENLSGGIVSWKKEEPTVQ